MNAPLNKQLGPSQRPHRNGNDSRVLCYIPTHNNMTLFNRSPNAFTIRWKYYRKSQVICLKRPILINKMFDNY
jgi:hypothetical protein